MSLDLGFTIAAILLLLVLSAFFSGSETGLTAVSRARLTELERRGSARASMVLALTATRERLIGALLLGNNVVNISASALATVALVRIFGDSGAFVSTFAMTVLVLIFGEVLPKTYAIAYPDRVALAGAPIIRVLVAVFGPVVMTVEYIVKTVLRLFGVEIDNAQKVLSAHEELRGAIDLHHKEGTVVKNDRDMLGGILAMQDLEVSDIMVHRTRMTMIDGGEDPKDIVAKVLKSGHTRIPVWKETPDNIIGVLHAKNLFAALQKHNGDASKIDIEDILLPPWFVPDTRAIPDQLNAFLRSARATSPSSSTSMARCRGSSPSRTSSRRSSATSRTSTTPWPWACGRSPTVPTSSRARVPIRDLNRAFDWTLPDEEANTLAGLVIHEARMIPEVGQTFVFHGFRFEILKKRRHQITALRMVPLKRDGEAAE